MRITKVTITGADDATNIKDLLELTEEFPYVEWGILVGSTSGRDKFPTKEWITKARMEIPFESLSVHYCGSALKGLLKNGRIDKEVFPGHVAPKRMQLNLGYVDDDTEKNIITTLKQYWDVEIILPLKETTKYLTKYSVNHRNISFLFDSSGGNGVTPNSWPRPITGLRVGYAGGLGPTNIKEQLEQMDAVTGEGYVWIDMEKNVRSGNSLDLDKVVTCLRAARKYLEK